MQPLKIKVKASTDGEAYREIATGTYENGTFNFPPPSEHVPEELMNQLHRHFKEFGATVGITQNYTEGKTLYQASFTDK